MRSNNCLPPPGERAHIEDCMTESSTVTKTEDQQKAPDKGADKTVPVEAVGEARAQKRAAQERAEAAEAKLKLNEQGQPDWSAVTAALAEEAKREVEAQLAPYKAEAAKGKLAMEFGLNAPQADKVMEVKAANPTLTDSQALLLARAANAEMFQAQRPTFIPGVHGGFPTGGSSPLRTQSETPDFTAKMHEAKAAGNQALATELAQKEAVLRFKAQFEKARPQ